MAVDLSIVGRKKSGKTSLIEKLIPEFTSRGYRVVTVKHSTHDHEFDIEGTDSWRHRRAGSEAALIIAPGKWVCHAGGVDPATRQALERALFADKDLIIWEGGGNPASPRIECVPAGKTALHAENETLVALFSSEDSTSGLPRFTPEEIPRLARWIVSTYLS